MAIGTPYWQWDVTSKNTSPLPTMSFRTSIPKVLTSKHSSAELLPPTSMDELQNKLCTYWSQYQLISIVNLPSDFPRSPGPPTTSAVAKHTNASYPKTNTYSTMRHASMSKDTEHCLNSQAVGHTIREATRSPTHCHNHRTHYTNDLAWRQTESQQWWRSLSAPQGNLVYLPLSRGGYRLNPQGTKELWREPEGAGSISLKSHV